MLAFFSSHTHRVVRGSLLAIGRPDGRLNALATAEAACCLSVNQASSIQNYGITCEAFTLGHNPYALPLSQAAAHIPTSRKEFISEYALSRHAARGGRSMHGACVSAVMGLLGSLSLDEDLFKDVDPTRQFETIPPLVDDELAERTLLEPFVGAWMSRDATLRGAPLETLMLRQGTLQEIYEGRVASLERFVGFLVLFHHMAKAVQDWWAAWTLGLFKYDMSRSHSILRIATTASPISGAEVREGRPSPCAPPRKSIHPPGSIASTRTEHARRSNR